MTNRTDLIVRILGDATSAKRSLAEVSGQFKAMGSLMTTLKATFSAALSRSLVQSLTEAQLASLRLHNQLNFTFGGAKAGSEAFQYAADLANRLGLDLAATAEGYAKFATSARAAGLSVDQANAVFEGVSKAVATMGLSVGDANGVFLALSQMLSKGKVSAEELRGQLGERLPGALAIAARAMGVSQAEFSKLLDTGKIMANDFLPKFAAEMERTFGAAAGQAAQTAIGNVNRLSNSWEQFKQRFGTASNASGVTAPAWLTAALNEANAAMDESMRRGENLKALWLSLGGFGLGASGNGFLDKGNRETRLHEIFTEIDQIETLQSKLDQTGGTWDQGNTAMDQSLRAGRIKQLRAEAEEIVRLNNAELAGISIKEQVRRRIQDALDAQRKAKTSVTGATPGKEQKDLLAALLDSTETAKLARYSNLLGLLVARWQTGKIGVQQYTEAVAKLVDETFGDRINAAHKELADEIERTAARQAEAFDEAMRENDARIEADTQALIQRKEFVDNLEQEAFLAGLANDERERALLLLEAERLGIQDINHLLELQDQIQARKREQGAAEELRRQQDDLYRSVQEGVQRAFADGLNAIATGEGGIRGAIKNVADMIRNAMSNAIAASLTDQFLGMLGGKEGVLGIAGKLGLGGKRDGSNPASAVFVQDVTAGVGKSAVDLAKTGESESLLSGIGTWFSKMFSGLGKMFSGLMSLLSSLFSTLVSAIFSSTAASSGSNAAGGLASLFGSMAGSSFAEGGYTGQGGKFQAAGTVHKGEYVMDQPVVRYWGLGFMDNLRRVARGNLGIQGPRWGYAEGGLVNLPATGGQAGLGGNVRIVNVIDPSLVSDWATSSAGERVIVNILRRNAGSVRAALA